MFLINNKRYKVINKFSVNEDETDIMITMVNKNVEVPTCEITNQLYLGMGVSCYKDFRYNFKDKFTTSDVFTYKPGFLLFDELVHCIVGDTYKEWEVLFLNLSNTLNEYSRSNKLSSVTIYFPKEPNFDLLTLMVNCFSKTNVKSIKILSIDKKETKSIEDFLYFQSKRNVFGNLIDKLIKRIGKIKLF